MAQRSSRNVAKQPLYVFDEEEEDEDPFQDTWFDDGHVVSDYESDESAHNTASEEEDSDDEAAEVAVAAARTAAFAANTAFGAPVSLPYYTGKNRITQWNKVVPDSFRKRNNLNTFKPGRSRLPRIKSVLESFELFFDGIVFDQVVYYTNLYIKHIAPKIPYKQSSVRETDLTKIRALFGLLFLIGSLKGSRTGLAHLWRPESGTSWDICRCTMSYQRFAFLMRYVFELSLALLYQTNLYFFTCRAIHFDDFSSREQRKSVDKFCHVRELFEHIVSNFQKFYTPGEQMTIDEQLIPFRGRCPFRQYIPSRPARYGIKTFALVDVESFYTFNLETYLGKQPDSSPFQVSNTPEDLVLRLVEPVKNSRRNITADNWFTGLPLIMKLVKLQLSYLGTVKKCKREIPPEFQPIKSREHMSSIFGFLESTEKFNVTLMSYIPEKKQEESSHHGVDFFRR